MLVRKMMIKSLSSGVLEVFRRKPRVIPMNSSRLISGFDDPSWLLWGFPCHKPWQGMVYAKCHWKNGDPGMVQSDIEWIPQWWTASNHGELRCWDGWLRQRWENMFWSGEYRPNLEDALLYICHICVCCHGQLVLWQTRATISSITLGRKKSGGKKPRIQWK